MGIKQKFIMLAGVVGIVLAIVSALGYYTAYSSLEDSLEHEIAATVEARGAELEGWLQEKAKTVTSEADLMTELSGVPLSTGDMHHLLSLAATDKDVQEMTRGDENKMFLPYYSPDETGKTDPTKRPWYVQAREAGRTVYTEVYQSKSTGDLVVSAVAPFYDKEKKFIGAICGDITLSVLEKQVQKIKYREEGRGYIIERTGKLLATAGKEQIMSEASEIPGIGTHLDEMYSQNTGFFSFENEEGEQVFTYTTVPSTGWIVGMAVPYDYVFAAFHRLRLMYAALTLVGLAMVVIFCRSFSQHITRPILALEDSATSMADGNLMVPDVPVDSGDEIGSLTNSFNQMKKQLHDLISHMAATSWHVYESSEELTANAQQSADASIDVAETVAEVASDMDRQLSDIDGVKQSVDAVFMGIADMTKQVEVTVAAADNVALAFLEEGAMMKANVDKLGKIDARFQEFMSAVEVIKESASAIRQTMDGIAEDTAHVVETMDDIDTVSRKTSVSTRTISAATQEQSAANEEIAASSQFLAKLASDMQEEIHKFKL